MDGLPPNVSTTIHSTHIAHTIPPPTHITHTVTPHTHITQDNLPYTCSINMASATSTSLAEMLSNIDALDVIPKLQVETYSHVTGPDVGVVTDQVNVAIPPTIPQDTILLPPPVNLVHMPATTVTQNPSISEVMGSLIRKEPEPVAMEMEPSEDKGGKKKPRVGRPRTKPQKEKADWHYHLGGVRHSRTPLSPELKEVLEVAYVSKIMSKNFRKEGQPEKERIARITGMHLDKVQEWFKNRRKKDKLQKDRCHSKSREKESPSSTQPITEIGYEHTPLIVEPVFLEIQTSDIVDPISSQSLEQVNSNVLTFTGNQSNTDSNSIELTPSIDLHVNL